MQDRQPARERAYEEWGEERERNRLLYPCAGRKVESSKSRGSSSSYNIWNMSNLIHTPVRTPHSFNGEEASRASALMEPTARCPVVSSSFQTFSLCRSFASLQCPVFPPPPPLPLPFVLFSLLRSFGCWCCVVPEPTSPSAPLISCSCFLGCPDFSVQLMFAFYFVSSLLRFWAGCPALFICVLLRGFCGW